MKKLQSEIPVIKIAFSNTLQARSELKLDVGKSMFWPH
jgi:hypothetical protein